MAPFKLKFRMGSSRSTSQDTDNSDHSTVGGGTTATATHHHTLQHHQPHGGSGNANDAQQQPLLQSHQFHSSQRSPRHSSGTLSLAESNTTLDSTAYSSSGSLNGNGDQRNLLPNNAAGASVTRSRSGDMSFGCLCRLVFGALSSMTYCMIFLNSVHLRYQVMRNACAYFVRSHYGDHCHLTWHRCAETGE